MAGAGLYGIAKAAVNSLTVVLAAELAKDNIRVNAVCPGRIETVMTAKAHIEDDKFYRDPIALSRWGSVNEVANGIVYLCSDASSYTTGDIMDITGGKFLVQNQARFNDRP
jgi:NAD(P)-dependent dehydrogenase (short-subunit alcohol dehydrogenase family)